MNETRNSSINDTLPIISEEGDGNLPTNLENKEAIALSIFMSLMFLFGTTTNLLIVIVYRKKHRTYASLYLLFVLAVVDLIVSSIVIPFTLLTYFHLFYYADLLCQFSYFLRYSTSSISVCLLALIAIERYHTISSKTITSIKNIQLTYVKNSQKATIALTIICIGFSIGCFFLFEKKEDKNGCGEINSNHSKIYNATGVSVLILVLACLVLLYIKTYMIVIQNRNKIFIDPFINNTKLHNNNNNNNNNIHNNNNIAAFFSPTNKTFNDDIMRKNSKFSSALNCPQQHTKLHKTTSLSQPPTLATSQQLQLHNCYLATKNEDNMVISTIDCISSMLRVNDIQVNKVKCEHCTVQTGSNTTLNTKFEVNNNNKTTQIDVNNGLMSDDSKPNSINNAQQTATTTLSTTDNLIEKPIVNEINNNNDNNTQIKQNIYKNNDDCKKQSTVSISQATINKTETITSTTTTTTTTTAAAADKVLNKETLASKLNELNSNIDTFSQFIDSNINQDRQTQLKLLLTKTQTFENELNTLNNNTDNKIDILTKLNNYYSKLYLNSTTNHTNNTKPNNETMSITEPHNTTANKNSPNNNNKTKTKPNSNPISYTYSSHAYLHYNSTMKRDWRVAKMFGLVTITSIITWLPWGLVILQIIDYNAIIINTYFINACINPIIYSFLSKSFRKEAMSLFNSTFKKKSKRKV